MPGMRFTNLMIKVFIALAGFIHFDEVDGQFQLSSYDLWLRKF